MLKHLTSGTGRKPAVAEAFPSTLFLLGIDKKKKLNQINLENAIQKLFMLFIVEINFVCKCKNSFVVITKHSCNASSHAILYYYDFLDIFCLCL